MTLLFSKKINKTFFSFLGSLIIVFSFLSVSNNAEAEEAWFAEDKSIILKAEVLRVINEEEQVVLGTEVKTLVQDLEVKILEGEKQGETVRMENDFMPLRAGDKIYINQFIGGDGLEYFSVKEIERRGPLLLLLFLFVGLIVWLSRWQGVRALFSLMFSIVAIVFFLIPALLAGYSPALASIVIAGFILSVSLFLTHGFKARVVVTFLGTFSAVVITCLLSYIWVKWMRFTGLGDDVSVFLNFATKGTLDLAGLLLGSIIIGLLGLLDDVSITQASVVEQLKITNPKLGFKDLYRRAIRVGRDHVGSLVNTLSLAYVGVALPLILLSAYVETDLNLILNQEVVVAELIRIIIGSIGLVLAVPITTALAAWYFKSRLPKAGGLSFESHHHH